jgi:arginine decarboxylase
MTTLSHDRAPYAEAVALNATGDWHRLSVPGHQNQPARHLGLASLAGPRLLTVDTPPLTEGIDLNPPGLSGPTPFQQALALAADAWGARRTWFLTNGASQGNHATCMALRRLAPHMVVQRSVHSSVIDGSISAGMRLHFASPSIDLALGIAHGVTPETLDAKLAEYPGGAAAYVVSPSYLGAIADIRALREVAHGHGVPLVVDEAWGAHLGFHPSLPRSALQCGADVVISSTHKLAGSLTQSAMLHLGSGPYADLLEAELDRAMLAVSSTSQSAILYASLDLARRDLMIHSDEWMPHSVASADLARELIVTDGRFTIPNARIMTFPDVHALDPLKLVVDTRSGGISGHSARDILENEYKIHVEMSTDSMIVGLVGALSIIDSNYVAQAFAALPYEDLDARPAIELPDVGPRAMDIREAYYSETEVVPASAAIGRISADSLAAYPPGVPNVLPGETITSEVLTFLKDTAAAPYGYVRGALDATISSVRVVKR